jgi:hypothetical protein
MDMLLYVAAKNLSYSPHRDFITPQAAPAPDHALPFLIRPRGARRWRFRCVSLSLQKASARFFLKKQIAIIAELNFAVSYRFHPFESG